MSDLSTLLQAMFGSASKVPEAENVSAPPLVSYPTTEDAAFARESGFAYGTANEPYVENKMARVLATPVWDREAKRWTVRPRSASGMSLGQATSAVDDGGAVNVELGNEQKLRKLLMEYYGRAALAANRSSIATLGYDPSRTVVDTEMGKSNFGGAYSPSKDAIYAVASDPSAIIHESIHRGLQKLRKNPEIKDEISKVPEEMIVRYLMAKLMGDPEKEGGSIDKQQRGDALHMIDKLGSGKDRIVKFLEEAAQRMIAKQKPGGPR